MYGTMYLFECMKPYSDSQVMLNPIVTAMDEPAVNNGGLHPASHIKERTTTHNNKLVHNPLVIGNLSTLEVQIQISQTHALIFLVVDSNTAR